MAKAQNLMTAILLLALIWFTVRGLPKVDWANFFGGEGWMTHGWGGLFATSTLLTYSLLGATSLAPYSAQAKNPQRDIPLAAVVSTGSIAILFALMGIVGSGILPLDQVANQTLGVIANHFLTKPEYIFFMVGGALLCLRHHPQRSGRFCLHSACHALARRAGFPRALASCTPSSKPLTSISSFTTSSPWRLCS